MLSLNIFDLIFHLSQYNYLPDFVLGFAFFTALGFTALGDRFENRHSRIVMASVIGLALATGLVAWERKNHFAISDLGPFSIFILIILFASVCFYALQRAGGYLAGTLSGMAALLLSVALLGVDWPGNNGLLAGFGFLALVLGVIVLIVQQSNQTDHAQLVTTTPMITFKDAVGELRKEREMAIDLDQRIHAMDRMAQNTEHYWDQNIRNREGQRENFAAQMQGYLEHLLPTEQQLTKRIQMMRTALEHMSQGQFDQIHEMKHLLHNAPIQMRHQIKVQIQQRLHELHAEKRVERLAKAAAKMEHKVTQLTEKAKEHLAAGEIHAVPQLLEHAEKLQHHAEQLLKTIEQFEARFVNEAQVVAQAIPIQH